MTTAQDLAINVMLSQQAKENFVAIGMPVVKKVKTPKTVLRVVENVTAPKQVVPGMAFTMQPGTVQAAGFMKLWRTARDRNEQIQAINAFTGFDNKESFAVNEYRARTAAQKELAPHRVTAESRTVSGKSHVAGMPDYTKRKIQDLLGRETLAAETLVNHELTASNLTEGSIEQLTALGLAEIERERLTAIRQDLALLTK